ncbi:hypothetical protein TanjilG_03664 [Lupinus angustifolius]|uniref:VQ domain-containing protein n=1 Tax=Lupinus angustifolius TaxID=3871 RepID=A0A1J7HXK9_LUPAN|nr:PREDICTED: VQ motif-containing protein 19-like [Lupinus angustifolius]OIW05275.1 hypothetical protein TanjilG_03664 [Lupinus angustifolius]
MEMISKIQQSDSPMNPPKCSNIRNSFTKIPTPPFTTRTPIPYLSPRYDSIPTTFVHADTSTFKQVVQMLTGLSETTTLTTKQPPPQPPLQPPQQGHFLPSPPPLRNFNIPPKKQGFKLYERRNNSIQNSLMINTLMPSYAHNNYGFSQRKSEIMSPSFLDFPSLALSPVTPLLNGDPFEKSSPFLRKSSLEEEKAIATKGFYLHPSSRTITARDSKPKLLPLFPVTSPGVSGSSSS